MNRRLLVFGLAAFGVAAATAVHAQKASPWDGTWSGTTERGGAVQIVVSGGKAASYNFRGSAVPVTGSQASADAMTINVNGGIPGTVRLSKGKGNSASYSYSDTGGGSATATLTKQ